jgi:hypothetical protein
MSAARRELLERPGGAIASVWTTCFKLLISLIGRIAREATNKH